MQELLVDIDDLDELYRCYMPYLKKVAYLYALICVTKQGIH